MTTVLVVVVIASVVTTGVLAAMLWQMKREATERADATVAALERAIENEGPASPDFEWPPPAHDDDHVLDTPLDVHGIFGTAHGEAGSSTQSGPVLAAIALGMAGLMAGVLILGTGWGATEASGASAPAPIELLSLRHDREGPVLTVTGFVRNPAGGGMVERLTATVFFFGADGTFLASGRAPLDFTRLGPGDESPFTVTAQVPDGVRRYRVSFRQETGGVAPHVDRRGRP